MKTILCYGDSNTYGYDPETGFRYPYEDRWTTILQKRLGDEALVIPEGLNGRTTCFEDEIRPGRNGFAYLEPCLHSHGPIDLVVLMLGTNDLKIRFQLTPTDIGKAIDRLILTIKMITPQKRMDQKSARVGESSSDRLFGWGKVCQAVQTGCLSFDNREPSPFGRGGGRKMWRNPWNQAAAGLSLRGGSYIII